MQSLRPFTLESSLLLTGAGPSGGGGDPLDVVAPISGTTHWPQSMKTVTGPVQSQHALIARVAATGIRLMWINPTAVPLSFVANARLGFAGEFITCTVGGSPSITIPAYGRVESDSLGIGMAAGEYLYCRAFFATVGDVTYGSGHIANLTYNPEGVTIPSPVSGFNCISGWVEGTNRMTETGGTWESEIIFGVHEQPCFVPYAILGRTTDTRPFVTVIGDSKTQDTRVAGTQAGIMKHAFGDVTGRRFQNLSLIGDFIGNFANPASPANELRQELMLMWPGIIINRCGTNSISNGADEATVAAAELAHIETVKGLLHPASTLFCCTVDPNTTKDGGADWATITEAQQDQGGDNLKGVDCPNFFNNLLLTAPPAYIDGVIDTAAEVANENGYWLAGMTSDGIHQTDAASALQGPVIAAALA